MSSQSLAGKLLELLKGKISVQRRERKLRLCETLSLGERRFLAVVMVEEHKFLVGGGGNSVALLAQLPAGTSEPIAIRTPLSEVAD